MQAFKLSLLVHTSSLTPLTPPTVLVSVIRTADRLGRRVLKETMSSKQVEGAGVQWLRMWVVTYITHARAQ